MQTFGQVGTVSKYLICGMGQGQSAIKDVIVLDSPYYPLYINSNLSTRSLKKRPTIDLTRTINSSVKELNCHLRSGFFSLPPDMVWSQVHFWIPVLQFGYFWFKVIMECWQRFVIWKACVKYNRRVVILIKLFKSTFSLFIHINFFFAAAQPFSQDSSTFSPLLNQRLQLENIKMFFSFRPLKILES